MLFVCRVTLPQVLSGGEDELLEEKCLSVSVYQPGSRTHFTATLPSYISYTQNYAGDAW